MKTKSILITGAATGIGCCTARKLDKMGWRVFAGILPNQDASALFEGGTNITTVDIDVTNNDMVLEAAAQVKAAVGEDGLYAIHNNAGIADIASGMLAGVSIEETKTLFDINLFGMIRVIQAFLPLIHDWGEGRIVNMSSGNARVAVPTAGPYMMSKMGVEALTRTLRMEMAPWGIEVCCIEPGGVKTPMTHNADANMRRKWEIMPQWVRDKYERVVRPANDNLLKSLENANEPEVIADKIIYALTVKNPKIRYVAGHDVKYLPLAQNLMSETRFESILLKKFGLTRNSEVK